MKMEAIKKQSRIKMQHQRQKIYLAVQEDSQILSVVGFPACYDSKLQQNKHQFSSAYMIPRYVDNSYLLPTFWNKLTKIYKQKKTV